MEGYREEGGGEGRGRGEGGGFGGASTSCFSFSTSVRTTFSKSLRYFFPVFLSAIG